METDEIRMRCPASAIILGVSKSPSTRARVSVRVSVGRSAARSL